MALHKLNTAHTHAAVQAAQRTMTTNEHIHATEASLTLFAPRDNHHVTSMWGPGSIKAPEESAYFSQLRRPILKPATL